MKRILLVFGTRPEAIKMCPLIKELRLRKGFHVSVCVTGQHLQMLKQVLDVFEIVPDYSLSIMKENQTLFNITISILEKIKKVLEQEKPDVVMVHGDTTTAFASALACYYMNIPVGHVEAGLRTYNIHSPYPEEFNRQAIGIVAKYNFAPTEIARQNLINEGKPKSDIYVTGNTVIDALETTVRSDYEHPDLTWASDSRLILLTAHRRENLGKPLANIFEAVKKLADSYSDVKVIYPVHLNPKVREIAYQILAGHAKVRLIEPLDALSFHNFMARSYIILTDSGGIQEEAPSLGKPVLVLRDTTERPEGIAAGTASLTGTDIDKIFSECCNLLDNKAAYSRMSEVQNPYGDGTASKQIADILEML